MCLRGRDDTLDRELELRTIEAAGNAERRSQVVGADPKHVYPIDGRDFLTVSHADGGFNERDDDLFPVGQAHQGRLVHAGIGRVDEPVAAIPLRRELRSFDDPLRVRGILDARCHHTHRACVEDCADQKCVFRGNAHKWHDAIRLRAFDERFQCLDAPPGVLLVEDHKVSTSGGEHAWHPQRCKLEEHRTDGDPS